MQDLVNSFVLSQVGKSYSSKKQARIVSSNFLDISEKNNPKDWTRNDVFSYLAQLEKYSHNTQYVYSIQLRTFLRFFGRNDLAEIVKSPKRPETLKIVPSLGEVQKMIDSADTFRDRLIIQILFRTGLRIGELCNLYQSDIDLEKRQIRIQSKEDWHPKGLRERIVPIDKDTKDFLTIYPRRRKGRRLFTLSESQVRRIVKSLAFKAQVKDAHKVSPHSLRHAFAIHFLTHGGDIRSLQKILGHSDLATTAIYLDLSENDITQAYDKVFYQTHDGAAVHKIDRGS